MEYIQMETTDINFVANAIIFFYIVLLLFKDQYSSKCGLRTSVIILAIVIICMLSRVSWDTALLLTLALILTIFSNFKNGQDTYANIVSDMVNKTRDYVKYPSSGLDSSVLITPENVTKVSSIIQPNKLQQIIKDRMLDSGRDYMDKIVKDDAKYGYVYI